MENLDPAGKPSVLILTRKFWPHSDDAIGRLISMVDAFRRRGANVTVLAARFAASWPLEFDFREARILRPIAAPRGDWSTTLYTRGVGRWLRENVTQFDGVYVDTMREEAGLAIAAAHRAGLPCVVRCSGVGSASDLKWAAHSRGSRRIFNEALRATAIVAPDPQVARDLIAAGAPRASVIRIDDGIPHAPRWDPPRRIAARRAMAAINGDLQVPDEGRVLLSIQQLDPAHSLEPMVRACTHVLQGNPDLRLWIIGDGPAREQLHRTCCDLDIRRSVAMPGWFGHVAELYEAADAYLCPSDVDSIEHRTPMALGAGLPALVVQTPVTRARLGMAESRIHWYQPDVPDSLARGLDVLVREIDRPRSVAGLPPHGGPGSRGAAMDALWSLLVRASRREQARPSPPREAAS